MISTSVQWQEEQWWGEVEEKMEVRVIPTIFSPVFFKDQFNLSVVTIPIRLEIERSDTIHD